MDEFARTSTYNSNFIDHFNTGFEKKIMTSIVNLTYTYVKIIINNNRTAFNATEKIRNVKTVGGVHLAMMGSLMSRARFWLLAHPAAIPQFLTLLWSNVSLAELYVVTQVCYHG